MRGLTKKEVQPKRQLGAHAQLCLGVTSRPAALTDGCRRGTSSAQSSRSTTPSPTTALSTPSTASAVRYSRCDINKQHSVLRSLIICGALMGALRTAVRRARGAGMPSWRPAGATGRCGSGTPGRPVRRWRPSSPPVPTRRAGHPNSVLLHALLPIAHQDDTNL